MIHPDHDCSWTRRRLSELSRNDGQLSGAGLSLAVLVSAAHRLGIPLTRTRPYPDGEQPDDVEVMLGSCRGNIHDGCFIGLESDEPRLLRALISATLELHESYLEGPVDEACVSLIQRRLANGMTVRLRSVPRQRRMLAKWYRHDAGWWERLTTPFVQVFPPP